MSDPLFAINGTSAADLRAHDIARELAHMERDYVRFTLPGDAGGFEDGEEVVITLDGQPYFRGVVEEPARHAQGKRERRQVNVAGAWWYLEEIFFRQDWKHIDDVENPGTLTPKPRARVILGQDIEGQKINIGEIVTEVLNYAIAAGAPIAIGSVSIDLTAPWDELRNPTCAEAIRKALRWVRDALWEWDYSQSTPAAHVRRRSAATAVTLSLADSPSHEVRERTSLARPAVVLEYHRVDRINEIQREETDYDIHPDPLPAGWQISGVVIPLTLAGAQVQESWLTQEVKTRTLPNDLTFAGTIDTADVEHDAAVVNFWKRKHAWLGDGSVSNLKLRNGNRNQTTGGLTRELDEEGAIAAWMNVTSEVQRVTVEVEYDYTDAEAVVHHKRDRLEASILATDAQTRTYSMLQQSSYTPPEAQPAGLAEAFYQALQGPHHEGSITIGGKLAQIAPGQVLNIDGGKTAWKTMRAVVQRVDEQTRPRRIRVSFGPPEHLSPQQLSELARVDREKRQTTSWQARTTGKAGTPTTQQQLPVKQAERPGATSSSISVSEVKALTIRALGTNKVKISQGDVAGVIPSNINTEHSLADGTHWFWIRVTFQDDAIDTVVIETGGSLPSPAAPDTDAIYPDEAIVSLGTVTVTSGAVSGVSQSGAGSFGLYWNATSEVCRLPDPEATPPEPGGNYVKYTAVFWRQ